LLAALGLRPVATQRPDRLRRSERTRGLPLTRRLLCLLSYEGLYESTSAVPERERPVGRGVSLHVTWPVAAHIPSHQHHVVWPRSARTHPKWSG